LFQCDEPNCVPHIQVAQYLARLRQQTSGSARGQVPLVWSAPRSHRSGYWRPAQYSIRPVTVDLRQHARAADRLLPSAPTSHLNLSHSITSRPFAALGARPVAEPTRIVSCSNEVSTVSTAIGTRAMSYVAWYSEPHWPVSRLMMSWTPRSVSRVHSVYVPLSSGTPARRMGAEW
jgi:hypothetical protein